VIGHVFDAAAGFQQMHGHGMAQGMDRAFLNSGRLRILLEQLLHLALLQGSLASGKEVGPDVTTLPQITAYELGRMPPQRLLSA
jgi:hypothetical protein